MTKRSLSRRRVLQIGGATGLALGFPGSLAALQAAAARNGDDRRLVLLFLEGGNDGLNTVVPLEDDAYRKARARIGIAKDAAVALDELTGLHPSLAPWQPLFEEGRLTILRDVGYDRPDRSHFVSRDIWHSGRREPDAATSGWVGRALESLDGGRMPGVALGAEEAPLLLRGEQRQGLTLKSIDDFRIQVPDGERAARLRALQAGAAANDDGPAARIARLAQDSYRTVERLRASLDKVPAGDGYPPSALAERLQLAARFIRAENGPPVLWTQIGGFDTHALQAGTHASLLRVVGEATTAFVNDLARDGALDRTLLVVYSEFGRRVMENGSQGTDHGAAGPVFALGGKVRGGFLGRPSDLSDLVDGDVRPQFDFRSVFGEAAGEWMGWDRAALFGDEHTPVGFLG